MLATGDVKVASVTAHTSSSCLPNARLRIYPDAAQGSSSSTHDSSPNSSPASDYLTQIWSMRGPHCGLYS
jgi:hypothetical protein